MYLAGQEGQRGYAMAAMLIMISLLGIAMIAVLPVWRQQAQREKEAELAFRGEQYARAIYLFRTKNGNQPPPNIDVLVQGRYLRKKYKDPITGEDFQPVFGGQQPQPGAPARGGAQPGGGVSGRGAAPGRGGPSQGGSVGVQTVTGSVQGRGGPTPTGVGGGSSRLNPSAIPDRFGSGQGIGGSQGGTGLVTVQSKSKESSIRIYNNASHYNEWQFLYNARGRGGPAGDGGRSGAPGIGGRGGPGSGRGGPAGPGSGTGGRAPGGRGLGRGLVPGGGRG